MSRNNGPTQSTWLASSSRTTTQTQADQFNQGYRGVRVTVDVTVVPGAAPSNVFTIEVKDMTSGKYTALLTSAAITGTGTTVLTVYPGVTETTNVDASAVLGSVWRVKNTAGNANAATYSVGVELLP